MRIKGAFIAPSDERTEEVLKNFYTDANFTIVRHNYSTISGNFLCGIPCIRQLHAEVEICTSQLTLIK